MSVVTSIWPTFPSGSGRRTTRLRFEEHDSRKIVRARAVYLKSPDFIIITEKHRFSFVSATVYRMPLSFSTWMTIFVPRMPIEAEGVIKRADSGLILAIKPDM